MKEIKGINVLERSDIERLAPSFYQTEAHPKMSDRYAPINSYDIAKLLWSMGWMPVYAREQRSNIASNRGYQRHMVRYAHPDFITKDGDLLQLVGTNSHNGISAYHICGGIWRKVCTNGLTIQLSNFGDFIIKHIGNIEEIVFSATRQIAENASMIGSRIESMQAIELTEVEKDIFASTAHEFIYGEEKDKAPIKPLALLAPRRRIDEKNDLWTTFNVIQENAVKGGIRGYNVERRRRVRTRQITSIDKDLKLNKALWSMAEKMREMKLAA